jgi:hypothetical protein
LRASALNKQQGFKRTEESADIRTPAHFGTGFAFRRFGAFLAGKTHREANMRFRERQSCQDWFDRELRQARERLDQWRDIAQRLRTDRRAELEHQLDELRGRFNRAAARTEGLRRARVDSWDIAAVQASEAFEALAVALKALEHQEPLARAA